MSCSHCSALRFTLLNEREGNRENARKNASERERRVWEGRDVAVKNIVPSWKVDIRLSGKGNSNFHGAGPVY
jgi:hypothetical protein